MYTLDDFDILYYSIAKNDDIGVDNLNEIDFKYADRIYLGSVEDGRWQEDLESIFQLWFFDLLSDSPEVELRIIYSGVGSFYSVEKIPFNKDVKSTINIALDRMNEIFDEELFAFYNSNKWFGSQVYQVLSELKLGASSQEENQIYLNLADIIETGELGFELDPSFRGKLAKLITLKPDEYADIDVDAFIYDRILKFK